MSQDAPALESLDAARVFNLLQQSLDDGKHTRSVLQDILVTLRRSNIVPRDGETRWVRFWHKYQTEADDYDREFLARYKEDMSTTMIFSGLFTAVTATVASMTISNLSQDPNLFTQILLHNIFVSLNHTGEFIQMDMPLLAWNGPSKSVVWSQTFLYASLICSLLAALGAVLATQWLSRYSAVDERGTVEDRGRRRQRKYDGLRTWHFRAFLEALPILLQISLLLFGIALCAYLWDQSRAIALVLIVINTVGGLLWLFTLLASSIYPDSPYDTPLSDFLARFLTANPPKDMEISPTSRPHGVVLRIRGWIATVFTNISTSLPQYMAAARETLDFGLHVFRGSTFGNLPSHVDSQATVRPTSARTIPLVFRTNITEPIGNAATRIGTFVTAHTTRAMRAIASPCYGILRLLGSTVSPIALTVISAHEERVRRSYPSPNGVRIAAFSWLLQTSTDPEVHTNAFLVVPQIVWEDNVFVELFSVQTLDFLLARLATCFLEDGGPRADSVERIVSLCASLLFIYWKLYDLDRNAQTPTRTWSYQTGRPLLELHGVPVVMRSLRDLDLAAHSHSNQDAWIIRYTYYTFRHLEENQERLPLVVVKFPSTTPSESTLSSGSESHFATPLRSHTLLYVSQAVYTIRNSDDCAALLQHIAEYSTSRYATSNTRYICLIATALLLGFGPQEVISFDWSQNDVRSSAANYIAVEIKHYIQWVGAARSRVADVFGIPEETQPRVAATETLSKIVGMLSLSGTFSVKRFGLDGILEELAASVSSGDRPMALSLCTSFLQVYWQLYHLAPKPTHAWASLNGGRFFHSQDTVVEALRSMDFGDSPLPYEESWVLQHTYLTFHHFSAITSKPQELVALGCPPAPTTPSGTSANFDSAFLLRSASLFYLAQVSYLDEWYSWNCMELFTQIEEYHDQLGGDPRTPHQTLLATATLLGFGVDATIALDYSTHIGVTKAIQYVLEEMERYLLWKPHEREDEPRISRVFRIWIKDDRFNDEAMAKMLRILVILHSAVQALPPNWGNPSAHVDWATEYIPRLCHNNEGNLELVYHCVVCAILPLSRRSDAISSPSNDKALNATLDAIAQLQSPPGNYAENPSVFHTYLQMQHATYSLIHSLLQNGHFRDTGDPACAAELYAWNLLQPQGSATLSAIPGQEQQLFEERDLLFVKILMTTAAGAEDKSTSRAWFDNPRHDKLVRTWIRIAHRWLVPCKSDPSSQRMVKLLSLENLLNFEKFRRPNASHWGEDLGCVQQVFVVVAVWWSWFMRLYDAARGSYTDYGDVVEDTLFIMKMDAAQAEEVEWYIRDTLDDTFPHYLPRIQMHGSVDPSLTHIQSVLKLKLKEIEQSGNNVINGQEIGDNNCDSSIADTQSAGAVVRALE